MARSTANGRRASLSLSTQSAAPCLSSSTVASSPMVPETQMKGVAGQAALASSRAAWASKPGSEKSARMTS